MSTSAILGAAFTVILLIFVGLAAFVLLVVYAVRRIAAAVRGEEYVPVREGKRPKYDHQDISDGATAKTVENVLKRYRQTPFLDKYARAGIADIENAERRKEEYIAVLNSKFQPNTISWQKFAGAADSAQQAILRNCADLANHVQTFDYTEFRRLDRAFRAATQKRGAPLGPADAEKRQMLLAKLMEMDRLVATNDELSVDLDRLAAELGKLEGIEGGEETQKTIDEIRSLIQEAQYYS